MKPKIFVTRRIPDSGLSLIESRCDTRVFPGDLPPTREELIDLVPGIDGLLCLLTDPIDQKVIEAAGDNLKVISSYAAGFDNIAVDIATARGIPVGNTPGVLTETTADLAFSLLASAARRIVEGERFAREGKWKTWGPTLLMGRDIHGATLGIMGMGSIGRAMARRGVGFGMRVIYCDRSPGEIETQKFARPVSFDQLLSESDFLSLHVPLTGDTRHIIDEKALAKMKVTAVLVNTARGGVVDHDALFNALKNGIIGYAALDVTEPEPLPPDHKLYTLSNCLIVPHLGSASVATRDTMAVMAAKNLLAGLSGERLPNCANPQVYE